eukprot:6172000-Pleurochrysis_carterae.AAC.1
MGIPSCQSCEGCAVARGLCKDRASLLVAVFVPVLLRAGPMRRLHKRLRTCAPERESACERYVLDRTFARARTASVARIVLRRVSSCAPQPEPHRERLLRVCDGGAGDVALLRVGPGAARARSHLLRLRAARGRALRWQALRLAQRLARVRAVGEPRTYACARARANGDTHVRT